MAIAEEVATPGVISGWGLPRVTRRGQYDRAWYGGGLCGRITEGQQAFAIEYGQGSVTAFDDHDVTAGKAERGMPGVDLEAAVAPAQRPVLRDATGFLPRQDQGEGRG